MAWNSNGTKLASGSVDQTARIWNIEPHGHVISLPLSFGNFWVFVMLHMEKVLKYIFLFVVLIQMRLPLIQFFSIGVLL